MRQIHELKTDPEPFAASVRGDKPYEVRFNDRNFQVADLVLLHETRHSGKEMRAGKPLVYTGRSLLREITEVRSNYGMQEGWVILGVRPASSDAQAPAAAGELVGYEWDIEEVGENHAVAHRVRDRLAEFSPAMISRIDGAEWRLALVRSKLGPSNSPDEPSRAYVVRHGEHWCLPEYFECGQPVPAHFRAELERLQVADQRNAAT